MLQATAKSRSVPLSLYEPIHVDLEEVERRLASCLTSRYESVSLLLGHSLRLSGKRLRPALLLLFGKAAGHVNDDHLTLSVSLEMVHTATLVHDDVLDGAEHRRHKATLNSEFGNTAAILTGDYLFSKAFFLASSLSTPTGAREIGTASSKVCEGEMRQIGTQGRFDLSLSEYLQIIDAKTAELCRCACKLGCQYAGASEKEIEAAECYGRNLGTAFQIIDDLLDLEGDEASTGKSLGTDFAQSKPTLPWIHLYQQANEERKSELAAAFQSPQQIERDHLMQWFDESRSIEYSKNVAHQYLNAALESLEGFADTAAKRSLIEIAEFTLQRDH